MTFWKVKKTRKVRWMGYRFKIGEHVKLNIKAITNQKHYPHGMYPKYVVFVESNKDSVFTIAEYGQSGALYSLEYNDEAIDWVFEGGQLLKAERQ